MTSGAGTVERTSAVPGLRRLATELGTFAVVGAGSTVLHLGGFVLLRQVAPPQPANAVALLVAAVLNTWANRRWTFGIRGREGVARHQVQGLVVFGVTLLLTSGGLALLAVVAPGAPTWVETGVVALTTVAATVLKYVAMRWWVFRGYRPGSPSPGENHEVRKSPEASVNSTTT